MPLIVTDGTSISDLNSMRTLAFLTLTFLTLCAGEESPPASANPVLSFSDSCGDFMVLQMAPAKAAVSGTINVTTAATVEVIVSSGAGEAASYKVAAEVTKAEPDPEDPGAATGFKWKAFLHPTEAGGDYTISASSGAWHVQISHVTFGHVW